ncbi:MAG: TlpA family protein disulfide reductase [Deltaproteobacteria bacterium]|jgi:thiol-disulfide isomerase/thioredoxin|nr:TlpA family protein disulfide reductase [Deltaproteobacteria bacterium]MBW2530920.1 TlpA family protein disulfide reductase [Deltaproteobacteria bacterium]
MKAAHWAQLLFVVAASVAAYSFVRAARQDQQRASCTALCALGPTYADSNRLVPDFELVDLSGTPRRLSTWFGRPLVLNFWTQHCEPCKKEIPSLAELAAVGRQRGFAVVTISADEAPDEVRALLDQLLGGQAPPFPVLLDPELEVIQDRFGTTKYPETWLIDEDRVIRARFDGERDWSNPLALEVVEMIRRPLGCPVRFAQGRPAGPFAALCGPS